jgi:RNA polymerase sigma-70 factor (ECF subfamily)
MSAEAAMKLERLSGDRDVLEAAFAAHGAHVRRVVLHVVGPSSDVSDLVHDVFVAAYEQLERLVAPEAMRAWLTGIALRMARAYLRSRHRWWHWPSLMPVTTAPAPTATPDVSGALREAYQALDGLAVDDRIAFVLRTVDRLKVEEIAAACGVSAATVKRRIKRAYDRLRRSSQGRTMLHNWLER